MRVRRAPRGFGTKRRNTGLDHAALGGILGAVRADRSSSRSLDARLAAARVEPSAEPHDAVTLGTARRIAATAVQIAMR